MFSWEENKGLLSARLLLHSTLDLSVRGFWCRLLVKEGPKCLDVILNRCCLPLGDQNWVRSLAEEVRVKCGVLE